MVITKMKKLIKRILSINVSRFLVVGGCSTLIDFTLYMLFSTKLPITLAKAMSMMISSAFSYVLNKKWVFQNNETTNLLYLVKYYLTFAANVGTNLGTNYLIYERTGHKILAFITATACAMIINFLLQKFFVFHQKKK